MAFWKQSEDPWDRKPEKRREPKESGENPIDRLDAWNERRRDAAREKEEARRLPPEPCPWCGQEMEQGFITGGRDAVRWYPGTHKFDPFRGLASGGGDLLHEGGVWGGRYKTAWACRDCKKVIFDLPDPPAVYEPFSAPSENAEKGPGDEAEE